MNDAIRPASPYVQPALVGGLVLGVLSALPIVNVGNFCCCMWIVSGGMVSTYFLQQRQPSPITASDAALAGLLAGVIGTVVYLFLSVPINYLTAPIIGQLAERLAATGNLPPQFRELASSSGRLGVVMIAVDFIARLFLDAIFSTIGGLLGYALFARKTPPAIAAAPRQFE